MLAAEADGADVSTIEGQANADGSLSAIQAGVAKNITDYNQWYSVAHARYGDGGQQIF